MLLPKLTMLTSTQYVRSSDLDEQKGDDEPEESGDHAPGNEINSEGRVELSSVENTGGGVHEGGADTTGRNKDGCIG